MPSFHLRIKTAFWPPDWRIHCPKPLCLIALSVIGSLLLATCIAGLFFYQYRDRFYPGIFVEGRNLDGLTLVQATSLLEKSAQPRPHQIILAVDDVEISSSSSQLEAKYLHQETLMKALSLGRKGDPLSRIAQVVGLLYHPVSLESRLDYNQEKIAQMAGELKKIIDLPGNQPSAELKTSGLASSLVINRGAPGRELNIEKTIHNINQLLTSRLETRPSDFFQERVEAVVASTSGTLTPEQTQLAANRAAKYVGHKLKLSGENQSLFLSDQEMVWLLLLDDTNSGINQSKLEQLLEKWNQAITRPPQNAELEYDPKTLKVTKFTPPRNGLQLNKNRTKQDLLNLFSQIETNQQETGTASSSSTQSRDHQLDLALAVKPPEISLAETNDLGINELIGFGESYYPHSIPNRIHNVAITTQKIDLIIIKPGEEFSFNKTVGEVSSKTGYKSAYVIRNGRTELGDGGGVCQVSSTLFRSLLDSGLKITKRKPHSYRVSYYEENNRPGFDATVYAGDVDLRFVNDTGHHLLIHAQADSENVYMQVEIFGTDDGRTTEIVDYKQWGYSPPPAAVYIPDPSLPTGVKRQVDWSASGLNVSFKHIVRDKEGNVLRENTYVSNYRPWSAKFLVGV
ncbi:MAG: VanW family protein [Patescibacteria group bacterium]